MLTLIVKTDDGARRKAVVKAGQEITIIRANPFLEKQGDYSLDIDLPLAGCSENIKIFGPAHRTEIAKLPYVGKRYPARLYAPPVSLEGAITITQFTEEMIKVQFSSGYSDFSNSLKDKDGNDLYIDELQGLGYAWEEDFPLFYEKATQDDLRKPYRFVEFVNNYCEDPKSHFRPDPDGSMRLALFTGTRDKTTCVAFPIHGKIGGNVAGGNDIIYWKDGVSKAYYDFVDNVTIEPRLPKFVATEPFGVCPQPYLSYIIKRILKSIGYNLVKNELEGTWLDNIFLANPRRTLSIKEMLPHLTVEEFFEEITKFFNVFIKVSGKDVSIVVNNISDTTERIRTVTHEFTDEIEEESNDEHVLTGNVAYDFKKEPERVACLPEEVYENSIVRNFIRFIPEDDEAYDEFTNTVEFKYIKGRAEDLRGDEENAITIFPVGNFRSGVIDPNFEQSQYYIDQLGSLIRNWNAPKANVKLKVIPARAFREIYRYNYHMKNDPISEGPGGSGGTEIGGSGGSGGTEIGGSGGSGGTEIGGPIGGFVPNPGETDITENTTLSSSDGAHIYNAYKEEGYPAIAVPDLPGANADLSIKDVINGGNIASKEWYDRIYIAVNLGMNYHYHYARPERYHPAAVGFNYDFDFWAYTDAGNQSQGGLEEHDYLQTWEYPLDEDKENGKRLTHCPFRLRETKSPCIVTDAWKNTEIDTRVVHTVQFTDQAISFDPTATYIIHGRRFACKKIELKITDRGLSPLKTGYFYEIKD